MNCPKCAADQDEARTECLACGVVFARWRPPVPALPPAIEDPQRTVPVWLAVAVLLVLVAFGVIWTAKRREARERHDLAAEGNAMLNDINNQRTPEMKRMSTELTDVLRRSDIADAPQVAMWPASLSREQAAQLLGRCSGFLTPETMGRRRVVAVDVMSSTAGAVLVKFTWKDEEPVASKPGPPGVAFAELVLQDGSWKAVSARGLNASDDPPFCP